MSITSNVRERLLGSSGLVIAMLAVAAGPICSSPAYAGAQPHMLQGINFSGSPNFLVGFDAPQNLIAPGTSDVPSVPSFLNPAAPTFTITGVENGISPQLFDLTFDINLPLTFNLVPISPTAQFTSLNFTANDATGAAVFNVSFAFETASGGLVTGFNASSFNPQPDIPGFGAGIEMTFNETSLSAVTLTINVSDANGNALNFAPIPEPETYTLLLVGLGLLGFTTRHRKQQAA